MAKAIRLSSENEAPPKVSELKRFFRVFLGRGLVVFGLIVIFIIVLLAIFPSQIAPYDPLKTNLKEVRLQPNAEHWLGTDQLGRDTMSRLIYGARIALIVGGLVCTIAGGIGVVLGAISGYFGGIIGAVIMRLMDMLMTIPLMILALTIAALLGGGLRNVVIALGVGLIPGYARMMTSQVLVVKETDYLMAGRSMGATDLRLLVRHIVKNSHTLNLLETRLPRVQLAREFITSQRLMRTSKRIVEWLFPAHLLQSSSPESAPDPEEKP